MLRQCCVIDYRSIKKKCFKTNQIFKILILLLKPSNDLIIHKTKNTRKLCMWNRLRVFALGKCFKHFILGIIFKKQYQSIQSNDSFTIRSLLWKVRPVNYNEIFGKYIYLTIVNGQSWQLGPASYYMVW